MDVSSAKVKPKHQDFSIKFGLNELFNSVRVERNIMINSRGGCIDGNSAVSHSAGQTLASDGTTSRRKWAWLYMFKYKQ